jgi:hypothetical protein
LKARCPRPSRRTRHVWCPRRRLLASLGLRPVAAQRPDRLRRSERTRDLPLTRRRLFQRSYEVKNNPLRLCPNASIPSDVVSRCTWLRPWVAHIPYRQHHVARPRSERTHPKWSGRRVSNSWPRPWRGRALPTELHPQRCKKIDRPVPTIVLRQIVKERPPSPVVRSIDRRPRRCVDRLKSK